MRYVKVLGMTVKLWYGTTQNNFTLISFKILTLKVKRNTLYIVLNVFFSYTLKMFGLE